MAFRKSLREELEALRAELGQHRAATAEAGPSPAGGEATAAGGDEMLSGQLSELNRLVQQMLDEAEETIAEHPVATVAGALALGIVIGRLTAR